MLQSMGLQRVRHDRQLNNNITRGGRVQGMDQEDKDLFRF